MDLVPFYVEHWASLLSPDSGRCVLLEEAQATDIAVNHLLGSVAGLSLNGPSWHSCFRCSRDESCAKAVGAEAIRA